MLWCLSVDDCTDRVLHLLATRSARETLGLNCEIKIRGPSLSRLHSGWYCDSPASAGSRCALTTQTGWVGWGSGGVKKSRGGID